MKVRRYRLTRTLERHLFLLAAVLGLLAFLGGNRLSGWCCGVGLRGSFLASVVLGELFLVFFPGLSCPILIGALLRFLCGHVKVSLAVRQRWRWTNDLTGHRRPTGNLLHISPMSTIASFPFGRVVFVARVSFMNNWYAVSACDDAVVIYI